MPVMGGYRDGRPDLTSQKSIQVSLKDMEKLTRRFESVLVCCNQCK